MGTNEENTVSLRISSVLSKVEPEPDLYTGSGRKVPAPSGSGTLHNSKNKFFPLYAGTFLMNTGIVPVHFGRIVSRLQAERMGTVLQIQILSN